MGKTKEPTLKQPKSVRLSTFVQSLVIAVLVTGIVSFIASYFMTINMYASARQAVSADMQLVSKTNKQ